MKDSSSEVVLDYDHIRLTDLKYELGDDSSIDDLKKEIKCYQAIIDSPRSCESMVKRAHKFIPKLTEFIILLEKEEEHKSKHGKQISCT